MIKTPLKASIVITTRNRKEELRIALESAVQQSAAPEVIVIDDGSTEGTAEMVRTEFSQVRLIRHDASRGLVVRRNEGARLATGDVVFSIDDDAEFASPYTVEQTLREFDDLRIGAVAIPFVEPKKDNRVLQRAPNIDGIWLTDSYIGTAHAVRRLLFLQLGGYREVLVHQGEERDFCVQLLQAGHVVRLGRADAIYHYESPKRDMRRMDYYGRRNDVFFVWHNVPIVFVPLHLAGTTLNGISAAWHTRRPVHMIRGLFSGYAGYLKQYHERSPVSASVYRLHRKLKKSGPCALEDIQQDLPPVMLDAGMPASAARSH